MVNTTDILISFDPLGVTTTDPTVVVIPPCDLDDDFDIDLDDFHDWQECLTGPAVPISPLCQPANFEGTLDAFPDVDLRDFADFQNAFGDPAP